MPKPIINVKNTKSNNNAQSINYSAKQSFENSNLAFRKKRSQNYLHLLKELDIAEGKIPQQQIDNIINTIKNELPELSIDNLPIGIVAKCYLGEDYEVHTLTLVGKMICKHYKFKENLPNELEKARNLANNEHYAFIEVYKDKLIAVSNDGTVSIIN